VASYATAISNSLGLDVELKLGSRGQFDVAVDGKTVVSRKGGLIALLSRKPWPSESAVVAAIQAASD